MALFTSVSWQGTQHERFVFGTGCVLGPYKEQGTLRERFALGIYSKSHAVSSTVENYTVTKTDFILNTSVSC